MVASGTGGRGEEVGEGEEEEERRGGRKVMHIPARAKQYLKAGGG